MRILKFGGTSLNDAERIKNAAQIVASTTPCITVCSAMGGMTNDLEKVIEAWKNHDPIAHEHLKNIRKRAEYTCAGLFTTAGYLERGLQTVNKYFSAAQELLFQPWTKEKKAIILATGEWVTSALLYLYLLQSEKDAVFHDACELMRLDSNNEPSLNEIIRLCDVAKLTQHNGITVTQGFICRDAQGNISNLTRGGSDYTATLLGAAIKAEAIEIWTDIDGLHNNDPRHVQDTYPIRELSYPEASELAYFGAKILHPSCVWPARERNIPILIKNTLRPRDHGTRIQNQASTIGKGLKAVAAKDPVTVIQITSGRMLNAYGFLKRIFEVFENYKTPVDVITTSEVSVSMTIDNDVEKEKIVGELSKLGRVSVIPDQCIVCAVGNPTRNTAEVIEMLQPLDLRMISLGAGTNNITVVLPVKNKIQALQNLQQLMITQNGIHKSEEEKANRMVVKV